MSDSWKNCAVCIAMTNQIAHNENEEAFEQATIEMELHPNHRRGAIVFVEKYPEEGRGPL